LSVAPLETVKALWGGELPALDSLNALNQLLGALTMGLWNQLACHQQRRSPFRLLRLDIAPTAEGITRIAVIWREELDGFVDGLFGKADSLQLPERPHRAMEVLSEIRLFFVAMRDLAGDPVEAAKAEHLAQTVANFRDLTRIADAGGEGVQRGDNLPRRCSFQARYRLEDTRRIVMPGSFASGHRWPHRRFRIYCPLVSARSGRFCGLLTPGYLSRLENAVGAAGFWMLDEHGGRHGLDARRGASPPVADARYR
jgi:hypothetical protein